MTSETEIISKDFLEKALGKKVKLFTVKAQADTGDNFMSILYTLDVYLESKCNVGGKEYLPEEPLYLLTKCYPMHPSRQEFLNSANIFWKELSIYKLWIPELIKFQQEKGFEKIIKPDFPTFIAGDAINFDLNKGELVNNNTEAKVYKPWDNYVMMVDLKKTGGFKLADRHVGLDRDHAVLIMDAQAKIHALSWAYKQAKNIKKFTDKFPFLDFDLSKESDRKMFESLIHSNLDTATEAVKSTFGWNSTLIPAIKDFKAVATTIMWIIYNYSDETEKDLAKYLKVKAAGPPRNPDDEFPWTIVLHGDSHMNNMLFRYDSKTHKPEDVILLDLQICREGCPTTDLAYIMYTSGNTEFRKNHMDEMLNIYFEKFNHYCDLLKCETLPGFTLEELKYRFHRMKPFGLIMGLIAGGIFLKEKEDAVQLDSLEGMSQEEIFVSLSEGMDKNVRYNKRATEMLQELQAEGII